MRTKTGPNGSADRHVKEITRKTRHRFSAEEKIRIFPDGLRGQSSIFELRRREGRQGTLGEALLEAPALDQVHGQVVAAGLLANVQDGHDRRVAQAR